MNLTIDRLCATYQKRPILEDISFLLTPGRITALTGKNGAGKSTLIRCLMGEKRDYTGRILLDGEDIRHLPPAERSRRMACLPQELPQPHVTVQALVSFGRAPFTNLTGKLSREDREKVDWAIAATDMVQYRDTFVDDLSGGERKKAFFAMTLAQDTPLVILDEPTAHLDTASRFAFLELTDNICRQTGKAFLMVMHDLPEMLVCAQQVLTLHDRRLAFDGTPEQFLASSIPRRCFGIALRGDWEQGFAVTPIK